MTQHQKIVKHLSTGKTLSQAQASKLYGITCLRGRVTELRQKGQVIATVKNSTGKTAYKAA
jgi:predicted XRE-type DNA-binding protein